MISGLVIGIVFQWIDSTLQKQLPVAVFQDDRIFQYIQVAVHANLFFPVLGGVLFGLVYIQKGEYLFDLGKDFYFFIRFVVIGILGVVANYLVGLMWFIPVHKYSDMLWGLPGMFMWYRSWIGYLLVVLSLVVAITTYRSEDIDLDDNDNLSVTVPAILGMNIVLSLALGIYIWLTYLLGGMFLGGMGWLAGGLVDLVGYGQNTRSIWGSFLIVWGGRIGPLLVLIYALDRNTRRS